MRNFILSATVLVFAGLSVTQAGTTVNTTSLAQDTTKKEVPADTTKKSELSYNLTLEQDTVKKDTTTTPVAPEKAEETKKN